jgi:lipopolysaccharide export system permease protein
LSLHHFSESFQLQARVDARTGEFQGAGKWLLTDVMVQQLNPDDATPVTQLHERQIVSLDLKPEDLDEVAKKSEEMGFFELMRYIAAVESEGYNASLYRVDLHSKIAFPIVCVLMTMIATAISIRRGLKDGLPVSISYGIGLAFLYHVLHSFCISLGYGEMLPPIIAAWSANIIFFCLGGYLLLNAE